MNPLAVIAAKVGPVTTATRAKLTEVVQAAQAAGHDVRYLWGYSASTSPQDREHHSGRAVDFMVDSKAAGDFIRDYLWAHRARLRVRHVIWWQRITSTVISPGVVRLMADRNGDPTQNHYDHVHVWFLDDGYSVPPTQGTPPPQTKPKKPPTVPRFQGTVRQGSKGPAVRAVQQRLADRGWRVTVDGVYGPKTVAVVRAFQQDKGLDVDGIAGPLTWRALWTTPIT